MQQLSDTQLHRADHLLVWTWNRETVQSRPDPDRARSKTEPLRSVTEGRALLPGLADFDDLYPQQLNLGPAVLEHLLGRGQHLPVLEHKPDRVTVLIRSDQVTVEELYFEGDRKQVSP